MESFGFSGVSCSAGLMGSSLIITRESFLNDFSSIWCPVTSVAPPARINPGTTININDIPDIILTDLSFFC